MAGSQEKRFESGVRQRLPQRHKQIKIPSAVSIMLERLCPRLIPRTTALEGRSTRGPLDGGATAVTSGGGALFSEGAAGEAREESLKKAILKFQLAL